jgi:hypothetical protein
MTKKSISVLFFSFFLSVLLPAQGIDRDSVIIKMDKAYRAKRKITVRLENKTGKEIFRIYPMDPPAFYRWDGKAWQPVAQIRYCGCSMECPPPPEAMPMNANDILEFEWDQMSSACTDREKGSVEKHKVKHGKYKVVFQFREQRYGQNFEVEKKFRIRYF